MLFDNDFSFPLKLPENQEPVWPKIAIFLFSEWCKDACRHMNKAHIEYDAQEISGEFFFGDDHIEVRCIRNKDFISRKV